MSPLNHDWMERLASHYRKMRDRYPNDKLLIMFDIDGTILDTRHMIRYVLQGYDRKYGKRLFTDLKIDDISFNENHVDDLLKDMGYSDNELKSIMQWYIGQRWSSDAILESHRPFHGVLEVIRWFQIQPSAHVGLNTGRSEEIREDTLRSLNQLGQEYRVQFPSDMLYMNRAGWDKDVLEGKAAGVEYFRERGYRVVAFIDNEPDNLSSISAVPDSDEILLLHAKTLFETSRSHIPPGTISGHVYDLTEFIGEKGIPRHIQFVWHPVYTRDNLERFLESNIRWIELEVFLDERSDDLIVRHYSLETHPLGEAEELWLLKDILKQIRARNKAVKLDFKEGRSLTKETVALLESMDIPDEDLWFNGNIERLLEEGYGQIKDAFPYAVIQCPIDFMAPLVLGVPEQAKALLKLLRGWGINRFSIGWGTLRKRQIINQLDAWNFDLNIYDAPNLEAFMKAALLQPRSLSSKFNFERWEK